MGKISPAQIKFFYFYINKIKSFFCLLLKKIKSFIIFFVWAGFVSPRGYCHVSLPRPLATATLPLRSVSNPCCRVPPTSFTPSRVSPTPHPLHPGLRLPSGDHPWLRCREHRVVRSAPLSMIALPCPYLALPLPHLPPHTVRCVTTTTLATTHATSAPSPYHGTDTTPPWLARQNKKNYIYIYMH